MSRVHRLRFTLPAAALLLALTACSNSAESPATPAARISTAYELPEERAYPEGIAVDGRTGDVYVGSFTTGAIYRGTSGNPKAEIFLPPGADGRRTANGLRVDASGRLWVIDHTKGVTVYNLETRALVARFDAATENPFLNDLTVTPDGAVYLTDSVRPVIYRITPAELDAAVAAGGRAELAVFTDLSAAKDPAATLLLNGIVSDPAGRYLLTVCMATGDLYRVTLQGEPQISKVALDKGNMLFGDGLELRGDTLWAVHNKDNSVSRWRLSADGTSAELQNLVTDEALRIPTTIAHAGDRALVVVSQFDRGGPMGEGTPTTPFRVVAIDGL
ncbi:SMP-30/gluconolactonase/LRE family protein [Nocardia sp. NPDC057668]|uniref:SMP-30/gluconolactonase/LRE family protein n=1 Tax=Nocardia sp. NPDC057668 TaxID=3346202 RepID=UPI0036720315